MTPLQILEEMIGEMDEEINAKKLDDEDWDDDDWSDMDRWNNEMDKLKEVEYRIKKECTILLSDGDNSYNIPYYLQKDFEKDMVCEFQEDSDGWYDWCDEFDKKYSQYKI